MVLIEFCHLHQKKPFSTISFSTIFKGTQTRTRPSLPNVCAADPNSEFNQTRPCNTHPCVDYEIEKGDWSECQLIGPPTTCMSGALTLHFKVNFGIQFRNVTCYTHDRKIAPLKYCEEFNGRIFETKVLRKKHIPFYSLS